MCIGCTGKQYRLDKKWAPLNIIEERPDYFFVPDEMMITLGDTVYVANLDSWLSKNDPNSYRFRLHMLHERVHSYRQQKEGLIKWLLQYVFSTKFRIDEEKYGFYVGILFMQANNKEIDVVEKAGRLEAHYFGAISQEQAELWVLKVINNKWPVCRCQLPPPVIDD